MDADLEPLVDVMFVRFSPWVTLHSAPVLTAPFGRQLPHAGHSEELGTLLSPFRRQESRAGSWHGPPAGACPGVQSPAAPGKCCPALAAPAAPPPLSA